MVLNPSNDEAFRRTAERLFAEDGEHPDELEAHLRGRFPNARVVAGIRDAGGERWYVYRDGSWTRPT
jgi:hypothetical protein